MLPACAPEAVLRRVQVRVAPSLEGLLAAALERDALQAEVVETAALRRSDVIKTALLRSVSHDLRSPLTAILTSAEALHSPSLTKEERGELATSVSGEAHRLSRLIDDLLDLSRLEADAADPHPSWCSVEEVVRRHTGEEWTVAFCGFSPGCGYLTGESSWDIPRRSSPRCGRGSPMGSGYSRIAPRPTWLPTTDGRRAPSATPPRGRSIRARTSAPSGTPVR